MQKLTGSVHLDLGCGKSPRNPFGAGQCFGLDLHPHRLDGVEIVAANLAVDQIPFEENFFDSVSAFDFIEHIPRQNFTGNGELIFPFVRLMDEVHRVLKPGGKLLAFTPCFPSDETFQDPTHVNPVTRRTHEYFCEPNLWGAMYGFKGRFNAVYVGVTDMKNVLNLEFGTFRGKLRDVHRNVLGKRPSHICWLLSAVK